MRTIAIFLLPLSMLPLGTKIAFAQARVGDYRAVLDAARRDTAETDSARITDIDLGRAVVGTDTFSAVLRNKVPSIVSVCLDLRTTPGMWLRRNIQGQQCFDLAPGEMRRVAVPYQFERLSTEGALRVRFGRRLDSEGYVTGLFFDKQYALGRGNPTALDLAAEFLHVRTRHLDIWARRGSLAEREVDSIAARREHALTRIAELLNVPPPDTVRLVFYPDSASKTSETAHTGIGLAFGKTLVEIYNDSVQLNPFHELVHITAGRLGDPPALFNEGLAVYLSERLGSDALEYLGSPGQTIDSAACEFARNGSLISLDTLFDFTEIGSPASRWRIAYPEAASFVKFLVETYGLVAFRQAYRTLVAGDLAALQKRNRASFQQIFGISLPDVEPRWRSAIQCNERYETLSQELRPRAVTLRPPNPAFADGGR